MKRIYSFLKHYTFSIICVIIIWILCFYNPNKFPKIDSTKLPLDKIAHFSFYAGTCLTIWWEYLKANKKERLKPLLIGGYLLPIAMSALIEYFQSLTNYRGGDIFDLLANIMGATFGIMIAHYLFAPFFVSSDQ